MKSENEALKDKAKKNLGGAQKYLNLYENDQSNQNSSNYQKLSVAEIRKKFETLPLKPPQKTEVKKSTRNTVKITNEGVNCLHEDTNDNVDKDKDEDVLSISNDDESLYSISLRPKHNKLEKLKNVLMEVVESEQTYVKRLNLFCNTFKGKVAMLNSMKYTIHWEDMDILFDHLSQVHKLHKDQVLPSFKLCLTSFQHQIQKMKGISEEETQTNVEEVYLGKSLISLSCKFSTYNTYAHNYTSTQRLFASQMRKVPQFASLVQQFQDSAECDGLKLSYYYIEPIQRLPRYELLLKEYISCLEEDSVDVEGAKKALEMVKDVNRLSNEKIREMQNLQKLKDIESSMRDSIDLHSEAGRWFIFEEIVDCIFEKGRKDERRFILLSDILLVCKVFPFAPTSVISDKFNVASITGYHEVKGTIYLLFLQKALIFTPRHKQTLKIWQQKLSSAISANAPRLSHSKSMGLGKSQYRRSRWLDTTNNNNNNDNNGADHNNKRNIIKYNTYSASTQKKLKANLRNNDNNSNNIETLDDNYHNTYRVEDDYDSFSDVDDDDDDDDDEHYCYRNIEEFKRNSIYIKQVIKNINNDDGGGDDNDDSQQKDGDEDYENIENINNTNVKSDQKNSNVKMADNDGVKMRKSEPSMMGTLGDHAPLMLNRQNVSSCMQCGEGFSFFSKKKSCYACGKVICTECSRNKECLRYMGQEMKRVCDACYDIIQHGRGMLPKIFNELLDGVG